MISTQIQDIINKLDENKPEFIFFKCSLFSEREAEKLCQAVVRNKHIVKADINATVPMDQEKRTEFFINAIKYKIYINLCDLSGSDYTLFHEDENSSGKSRIITLKNTL